MEGQEGSGDPSRELGEFGRVGRSRESLLEGQEGSVSSPRGLEGVESPPRRAVSIGRPSSRAGWGRESLLESKEGSGVSPRGPGVVGKLSRRAGRGWESSQKARTG